MYRPMQLRHQLNFLTAQVSFCYFTVGICRLMPVWAKKYASSKCPGIGDSMPCLRDIGKMLIYSTKRVVDRGFISGINVPVWA